MKTTRFAALLALYLEAPMGFGLLSMKLYLIVNGKCIKLQWGFTFTRGSIPEVHNVLQGAVSGSNPDAESGSTSIGALGFEPHGGTDTLV